MIPLTAQQLAEYEIMTVHEVAEYLRVTPRTVTNLAVAGSIPARRVGTLWRFSRKRITSFMSRTESPSAGVDL